LKQPTKTKLNLEIISIAKSLQKPALCL